MVEFTWNMCLYRWLLVGPTGTYNPFSPPGVMQRLRWLELCWRLTILNRLRTTGDLWDHEPDDRPIEGRDVIRDGSDGCKRVSKFGVSARTPTVFHSFFRSCVKSPEIWSNWIKTNTSDVWIWTQNKSTVWQMAAYHLTFSRAPFSRAVWKVRSHNLIELKQVLGKFESEHRIGWPYSKWRHTIWLFTQSPFFSKVNILLCKWHFL